MQNLRLIYGLELILLLLCSDWISSKSTILIYFRYKITDNGTNSALTMKMNAWSISLPLIM